MLAVVSPSVDQQHGTERNVAEWLARLAPVFEIHLYSQSVEDLDLNEVAWHKIPKLPGPHLFNYVWWFAANHLWRAWDRRFRGLSPDIVFSPGINCLDADAISVHIVFAEYLRRNEPSLRFRGHSPSDWPRLLHRKVYYALIAGLERYCYRNPKTSLISVSRRTGSALREFYGRGEKCPVACQGLRHEIFNPARRTQLRERARLELRLAPREFALLLVANDWRNKGLPVLLEALVLLQDLEVRLLAVGQDDKSPFRRFIEQNRLKERVSFLPVRKDVEFYYAAADCYTGPSLEDAFGQPPAEAMACGLPVITAITCGVSEMITDGVDGIVLRDPRNANELAERIRQLCEHPDWGERLGENAAATALQFTWQRSAKLMTDFLLQALRKKNSPATLVQRQEA